MDEHLYQFMDKHGSTGLLILGYFALKYGRILWKMFISKSYVSYSVLEVKIAALEKKLDKVEANVEKKCEESRTMFKEELKTIMDRVHSHLGVMRDDFRDMSKRIDQIWSNMGQHKQES